MEATTSILEKDIYAYNFTETNARKGVNVIDSRSALEHFLTPVQKTSMLYTLASGETMTTTDFNAVINDKGKLISVVRDSYKLVPNKDVIMPVIEQLELLDNKWYIDKSHSFISDEKMRIQITFPELVANDGQSDIAISLYACNTYDATGSVKLFFGCLRKICLNGMITGKVFSKVSGRHTTNFNVENLRSEVEKSYEAIPIINQKIEELYNKTIMLNDAFQKSIKTNFGTRGLAYVLQQNNKTTILNEWEMYNVLTYYISHYINYKARERYQESVSTMFNF